MQGLLISSWATYLIRKQIEDHVTHRQEVCGH